MNKELSALELADYLLNFIMLVEDYDESNHEKAATMLRQQQDTIQKLSERIKWLEGASKLIRGQTND